MGGEKDLVMSSIRVQEQEDRDKWRKGALQTLKRSWREGKLTLDLTRCVVFKYDQSKCTKKMILAQTALSLILIIISVACR